MNSTAKSLTLSKSTTKSLEMTLKVLAVIGMVLAIGKFFFPSTMEQFTHFSSAWSIGNIIRWFMFGGAIYILMAAFYKNEKMANVAKLFLIPLTLISIIFLPDFINFNTSLTDPTNSALLLTVMILEIVILIASSVLIIILAGGGFREINFWKTLKTFLFVVLFTTPLNILEFFKYIIPENVLAGLAYHNFGIWHLIAIFVLIAITLGLYFFLRKKDEEEKWQLLVILSLTFILTYVSKISVSFISGYQGKTQWFNMLPLYVCDIGAILIPIAMLTKKKFFLDNLFFVYAVGAMSVFVFMGIDSLNGNNYIFSFNYLYFILTHAILFALSIMPVLLKLFKPKFKGILNGIAVFTVLYIVATVVSAYISTIAFPTDNPDIWVYWMPNYCFTQICPLPLPLNFPSTTILGMSFNIPYLILLYIFYILMFLAFQGLWKIGKLIVKAVQIRKQRKLENKSMTIIMRALKK